MFKKPVAGTAVAIGVLLGVRERQEGWREGWDGRSGEEV
jgi:hypothetical protein